MKVLNNVITDVVEHHMCCGCGVCTAVCPNDALKMVYIQGEPRPYIKPALCTGCGRCLSACPDCTGRELDTSDAGSRIWVGYSTDDKQRLQSASGGVLTETLLHLLRAKEIDAACVAAPGFIGRDLNSWFQMKCVDTEEELRRCATSKYYPLHHADTLQKIKESHYENVAVVALPCAAQAIRNAMRLDAKLCKRIKFIFSPVCGHNVGTQFLACLFNRLHIVPRDVADFRFRDKSHTTDAMKYNFKLECNNGRTQLISFDNEHILQLWTGHLFSLTRCFFCEDFAGDYADCSFADAWLEEYRKDIRGHNFILSRSLETARILCDMRSKGKVVLQPAHYALFEQAQLYPLRFKKKRLRPRLAAARLLGLSPPKALVEKYANRNPSCLYGEVLREALLLIKVRAYKKWTVVKPLTANRIFRMLEAMLNPSLLMTKLLSCAAKKPV